MTEKESVLVMKIAYSVMAVLFAISLMLAGCAGGEKQPDTLMELICPESKVKEYEACEKSADRLENELFRVMADREAYKIAHRRCMHKFDKRLSKSR